MSSIVSNTSIVKPKLTCRVHQWAYHDSNLWLAIAALSYVLLYLAFFPQSYTSMDEASYMSTAYALRHGTVYPDVAGVRDVVSYPVHGHMISKYPLGMPLLLALMSLFGWQAALATNLIVHLATFYVIILLLRRLQIPALFALLYLLHPTAVLYSRTVMADLFSGLLLVLAFSSQLSRRPVATGAFLGMAVLCRTGNAIALPIFLGALLWEGRGQGDMVARIKARLKEMIWLVSGSAPFLLLAGYYAFIIAGGQMAQHTGTFSLSYFSHMFPAYVLGLLLIYPGMFFAPLLYRGPGRMTIWPLCYGFLLLYSFWYYRDQGGSAVETLIVGQRYFLAVLPLFVIAYAGVLWPLLRRWPVRVRTALWTVAGCLLFILAFGISQRHARYVARLARVRAGLLQAVAPQDTLFCNTQVGKLFHPAWGERRLYLLSGHLSSQEIETVKKRMQEARTQPNTHIFVAAWTRPGRVDDQQAVRFTNDLQALYYTRSVSNLSRYDLPPGVQLFQLLRPRSVPERGMLQQ